MHHADTELLRLLLHEIEDLYRALETLTAAVHGLTNQIAVRLITMAPEKPLPSIQQDER